MRTWNVLSSLFDEQLFSWKEQKGIKQWDIRRAIAYSAVSLY